MHILIMPAWYRTKEKPFYGSFFLEQAEALAEYGHKVTVIPLYGDAPKGVYVETRQEGGVTEHAVHYKKVRFHLTYVRIMGALLKLFQTILRHDRPDIIHCHSFRPIKYARALKALFGIPIVVTEHVTWFERGMLTENNLKDITKDYAAADAMVAVSAGLREQIRPYCGGKEIRVIPNIVSSRFSEGEFHAPAGERFGFVTVAMLDHKKGIDVLLRAFAALAAEEPRITLTVCGDGTERATLEALRDELGLVDSVVFTGNLGRAEVAEQLRKNQVFVLPSRVETFGVVYVEAMACGLPIIMTKTNAWEVLAAPETGIAVDIEDPAALAVAMGHVLRHYSEYDPGRIRQYCLDRFSENAVAGQLTELYQQVLEQR